MALEAARHLCQEARVVLTSLRGGPPMVARGDLAQDLMDVRGLVKHTLSTDPTWAAAAAAGRGGGEGSTVDPLAAPPSPGSSSSPSSSPKAAPPPPPPAKPATFEPHTNLDPPPPEDVGPFARPFLAVVIDPRAAGPHTLVALRSLHRLLEQTSLQVPGSASEDTTHPFTVLLEPLTKGVLNCKFEQTDAGADEAVEMAIADLLALVVQLNRRALRTETLMDAFNTVFVTRNTFVHSPALCYHFEDVLTAICKAIFSDLDSLRDPVGKVILEFLVNQLLHTPLVGGEDEASREAQMAHDATRVLCLRLARTAMQATFEENYWTNDDLTEAAVGIVVTTDDRAGLVEDRSLLQIIQDDLCLALLMTGQAVWAYQDNNNHVGPGFISLEVLSEICFTLSALWTSTSLRKHLVSQFESIFSGFYQRALVLLRKRINPNDSLTFHSNLYFDAGIEIILESLVDIMTLHDHRHTVAEGNGGSLETLFAFFDCNIKRSDVAVGLMVELCRCTGSKVDEEGDILVTSVHGDLPTPNNSDGATTPATDGQGGEAWPENGPPIETEEFVPSNDAVTAEGYRQVPPHLRELCAEAITGGMKCLFRDDHPSDQTKEERHNRQSIMAGHVSPAPQSWSDLNRITSSHHMRNIKSKKRLMRRAAQLFNKKSSKGIEFLVQSGVIEEPVTPRAVASFLRNALVVGLDKKAVGAYLGEVGKSPEAGKSPPVWQRDWFHKEVLETYCSLFRFERQSLLDGLRMFLAAFRLPGEAQQIDRILQAFSDCCSRVCEEGMQGSHKVFSDDPKRASDAAYLLSFSIIMLNTDQHNDNIREDRKMSKADFVKNNSDYGRDITEPGKELPREYLESIYDSIREEEIRTEGEGADGSMTVERWKDVLRGSAEEDPHAENNPSVHDAEDLTELVLEHVWMPIMSSISALWGVNPSSSSSSSNPAKTSDPGPTGMLGAQGARLGMDMAWDMLVGVRQLGRNDIFCKIFNCVCKYSQLLDYRTDAAARSRAFANSVESQSAFVVALRVAREATDEMSVDGWKRIWLMLFELRDLKMLGGGISSRGKSIIMESEQDLLKEDGRREWTMKLVKRGNGNDSQLKKSSGVSSVFGAMGRALFGSVESPPTDTSSGGQVTGERVRTVHGKEENVIWDEIAPSDDEDESKGSYDDTESSYSIHGHSRLTLGAKFESLLIQEDLLLNQQREITVTGLERVDDSNGLRLSPRARVRKRLSKNCDYAGLIADSRFMDDNSISNILEALTSLVPVEPTFAVNGTAKPLTRENSSGEFSTKLSQNPVSPASEAFAEILIAELALRNRDRLSVLWHNNLKSHYHARLKSIFHSYTEDDQSQVKVISGSMEKCITGLLRISCCAIKRGDICNDVLETWTLLGQVEESEARKSMANSFDRHLAEGLWRITRSIDGSSGLGEDGWKGLLALTTWCANRGSTLPAVRSGSIGRTVGLAEDDPSLQAYRSLHFLLNVSEIKDSVPPETVKCIRTLVASGEVRNCPKLSVAGLDLLHVLCNIVESSAINVYREGGDEEKTIFWQENWLPILDSMAEACHSCSLSTVRQHALSMLTDSFLENQGGLIPVPHLCGSLGQLCIPLAGRRIVELRVNGAAGAESEDEVMIELELCIGLIFKPLRHHIQNIVNEGMDALISVWSPILDVLKKILSEATHSAGVEENGNDMVKGIIKSSNELTMEHLRNVIMVLINCDVLQAEPSRNDDISAMTWSAIAEMDHCNEFLDEWKQAASQK